MNPDQPENKFEPDGLGSSFTSDDGKRKVVMYHGKDGSFILLFTKDGKETAIRMTRWAAKMVVLLLVQKLGKPLTDNEKEAA